MIKRVALVVVVGVVSLATLPYSIPVLAVVGVVKWYRRHKVAQLDRMVPAYRLYELQLSQLEKRLSTTVRETETLARMKYTAWKIRHEKEKQYFIVHGVQFPQTARRAQEDQMFYTLERRMQDEQRRFEEEARRIERDEFWRLADERRQQLAIEDQRETQAQQMELQQARMQAEREALEMIAKASARDLA